MSKTHHLTVNLNYAKQHIFRCIRKDIQQDILVDKETSLPISNIEFRKLVDDCEAKGFDVIPVCDSHSEKGHCIGHEEEGLTK